MIVGEGGPWLFDEVVYWWQRPDIVHFIEFDEEAVSSVVSTPHQRLKLTCHRRVGTDGQKGESFTGFQISKISDSRFYAISNTGN